MTPVPPLMDSVEVIQADRDAAAEYFATIAPTMPHIIIEARKNPSALARAFARHRAQQSFAVVEAEVDQMIFFLRERDDDLCSQAADLIEALTAQQEKQG